MVWSTICSGLPTEGVAQTFLVSEKTVKRAPQQYFATGDLLSECSSGRLQSLSEDNQVILSQSLLDNPGIYIHEVQEMYQEITGISLHPTSIIRYANRFGLTCQRLRRISISRSGMDVLQFPGDKYISTDAPFWWKQSKVCFDFRQRFNTSCRKNISTCRSQGMPSMVLTSLFARPKPYWGGI